MGHVGLKNAIIWENSEFKRAKERKNPKIRFVYSLRINWCVLDNLHQQKTKFIMRICQRNHAGIGTKDFIDDWKNTQMLLIEIIENIVGV